jgi:RNA polymerase sigma-70 factor (ECF subfamily)
VTPEPDREADLADAYARETVRDVGAWATITVARAALDTARSARRRREVYVGPWLPEPVVVRSDDAAGDPADRVSLDDTIRYALLVVLESLSPAERTAWVLHDLFGMPFGEIAEAVGRTPAAVRQPASRARAHVNAHAPRVDVSRDQHDAAVRSFVAAAAGGDLSPLIAALDPDVVLTSGGGGEVTAALRPVLGADKVGRLLVGLLDQPPSCATFEAVAVNGELGIGVVDDTGLSSVVAFTFDGGRITRIDMIRCAAQAARRSERAVISRRA